MAFRLWKPLLLQSRACITLRAHNVGALTVIAVVKGKGHSLETIARELALDLAACDYLPYTAAHLPCVANGTADSLLRKFDPKKQPWATPPMLAFVSSVTPAVRSDTWWRVRQRELAFSPCAPISPPSTPERWPL